MRNRYVLAILLLGAAGMVLLTTCKKKSSDSQATGNQQVITKIAGPVTVTFGTGTVMTNNPEADVVQDTSAETDFKNIAPLFNVTAYLNYQITLNIGSSQILSENINASWVVPENFLNSMPANSRMSLFAMVYQDGGDETMDEFLPLEADFNEATGVLSASLPYYIFTNTRTADKNWGAILMAAAVQDTVPDLVKSMDDPCGGHTILCPVGNCSSTSISSPFTMNRLHPIQNEVKPHTGVDMKVNNGSDVHAAADGTVEWIKINYKETWDLKPMGYGLYMILRHADGSATLYGHLSSTKFKVGDHVNRGDVIALSGGVPGDERAGGSTGAHLHFEYVPKGWILGSKNRIDPFPCITTGASIPVVQSIAASNITSTSATAGGMVISDGGAPVTFRGVCWNTGGNPGVLDNATFDGSGLGLFTSALSGLTPNTRYYMRAYATNTSGTAYGTEYSFTTTNEQGLDGYWTNGSIVLHYSGSSLDFSQVLGGTWLDALNQGWISIGTPKFSGVVKTGAGRWSCNELWWHTTGGTIDAVGYSSDGSISMLPDGSISTLSSNPWTGGTGAGSYTKVKP